MGEPVENLKWQQLQQRQVSNNNNNPDYDYMWCIILTLYNFIYILSICIKSFIATGDQLKKMYLSDFYIFISV